MTGTTRREKDLLGERDVPAAVLYGIHTLRALENFPITGTAISQHPLLLRSLASVKEAAARANAELGLLDAPVAEAIARACQEVRTGRWHDQFPIDVLQGGAGTSTNMNVNEVLANRALELLGHARGTYAVVHPLEHVNRSQSTNDVYPTAVRLALVEAVAGLVEDMRVLEQVFTAKADEFADVLTVGRTQLQDAVPMTLGQMFAAVAVTLGEDQERLREASRLLLEINLGATAIGTGITAPPGYPALARAHLARITGLEVVTAVHLVEATQDAGAFVQLSGVLKRCAVKLSKTCNDLRLLSSGPQAGLADIRLPAVQAGSSIMPGKVNPVIPEVVNQVAFEVLGIDVTVSFAAEAGQLQLNAFEPVIAHGLLTAVKHLRAATTLLGDRCVRGISVDRDRLRRVVERSVGLATALNPHIGYERATLVAQEALATDRSVYDLVLEKGWLTRERLDAVLAPELLTRPLEG